MGKHRSVSARNRTCLETLEPRVLFSASFELSTTMQGPRWDYATSFGSDHVIHADLNNDGVDDLVVSNPGWTGEDRDLATIQNEGNFNHTGLPTWNQSLTVLYADTVDDGTSTNTREGTGAFSRVEEYRVGASPLGVAVADFNGDQLVDLVSANADGSLTFLFNQDGAVGSAERFAAEDTAQTDYSMHTGRWDVHRRLTWVKSERMAA